MSDAPDRIPDELHVLAGEFVLGALEEAEMRAVRRQAAVMPALARAIEAWEWRLAPLAGAVAPVRPPAELWARLEQAIGPAPAPSVQAEPGPTPAEMAPPRPEEPESFPPAPHAAASAPPDAEPGLGPDAARSRRFGVSDGILPEPPAPPTRFVLVQDAVPPPPFTVVPKKEAEPVEWPDEAPAPTGGSYDPFAFAPGTSGPPPAEPPPPPPRPPAPVAPPAPDPLDRPAPPALPTFGAKMEQAAREAEAHKPAPDWTEAEIAPPESIERPAPVLTPRPGDRVTGAPADPPIDAPGSLEDEPDEPALDEDLAAEPAPPPVEETPPEPSESVLRERALREALREDTLRREAEARQPPTREAARAARLARRESLREGPRESPREPAPSREARRAESRAPTREEPPRPRADPRALRRQLGQDRPVWPWQVATAGALAFAASVVGVLLLPALWRDTLPQFAARYLPEQVARLLPAPGGGHGLPEVAAIVPADRNGAGFLVEARPDGTVLLTALAPIQVPAGKAMELWMLPPGASVPKSLGVLPPNGGTMALPSMPPVGTALMISLEPAGGSPIGVPTGWVMFQGKLQHLRT